MYRDMSPYGQFRMHYTPVLPQFYENIYSQEEGIKKILFEMDSMAAYLNKLANGLKEEGAARAELAVKLQKLADELHALQEYVKQYLRGGLTRDPVDGSYSPIYGVLKQIVDFYNNETLTWDECKATGVTWQQLADLGAENEGGSYMTYAAFDLESVMWLTSVPGIGYIEHETVCYNPVKTLDTNAGGYQDSREVEV